MVNEGYKKYINSKQWYRKRERWLELADYECQWCSNTQTVLQIHHLTYKNFYHEKDEDVIVLCRACHKYADRIRKHLKTSKYKKELLKYAKSKGYPFDMKNKSRHHVRRLESRLIELESRLEELNSIEVSQKRVLKAILQKGD